MSVASFRAGTITVIEGDPAGERLCEGRRRFGIWERPKEASMTFQNQMRAIDQAATARVDWRKWFKFMAIGPMV